MRPNLFSRSPSRETHTSSRDTTFSPRLRLPCMKEALSCYVAPAVRGKMTNGVQPHETRPSDKVRRKSQIAIEYAYRFRDRFLRANVLWIYAANDNQILRTYGLLTQRCRLPALETCPLNISQILDNWIQREDATSDHEPWLMI